MRNKIIANAVRFDGYKEGDRRDIAAYDTPQGAVPAGNRNFNRFSYIFDHLLEPKRYAGGEKDGLAWCATFVATCIGTADTDPEGLCRRIADSTQSEIDRLKKQYMGNLLQALGNIGIAGLSSLAGVASYTRIGLPEVKMHAAQPADLVIFGDNAHIGLVEKYAGGYLHTVEGNTTLRKADPNGGQVARKRYKAVNGALFEVCGGAVFRSWPKFRILMTRL